MEIGFLQHECYLPMKSVTRNWSDRVKKIREPMFSGYLFVKTDLVYRTSFLQIPGVVRFVSTQGRPETISPEEINRIKRIEENGATVRQEEYYTSGDKVKVRRGVFEGMEGILVRKVNSQPRFLIQLPLLKQAISVEISVEDLVKLN